jgi:hypothetical protein
MSDVHGTDIKLPEVCLQNLPFSTNVKLSFCTASENISLQEPEGFLMSFLILPHFWLGGVHLL